MTWKQIDTFHKTRRGYAIFGLAEAGLAYLFGTLAIDSGHLWQWALVAILLIGVGRNFIKFMDTFVHEHARQRRR